jgi:excisionase family DNA binding protein
MSDTELLTVDQLADRLHLRPRTVQAWARRGRIPAVKLSAKVVRFDWPAVLAALRNLAQPQGCRMSAEPTFQLDTSLAHQDCPAGDSRSREASSPLGGGR